MAKALQKCFPIRQVHWMQRSTETAGLLKPLTAEQHAAKFCFQHAVSIAARGVLDLAASLMNELVLVVDDKCEG